MADVVDSKTRSRMMSGIRSKHTQPEMLIRRELHRLGYRYKLHVADLAGHPDLVFPRYSAVIFVNGCFWHGHGCKLFRWPKTRSDFWRSKIAGNIERDRRNVAALVEQGWSVAVIWECALKGKGSVGVESVVARVGSWLALQRVIRPELQVFDTRLRDATQEPREQGRG